MGDEDAVGLVSLDPRAVAVAGLHTPSIGLDVLLRAEEARSIVLHDLENGRRVDDHVVDGRRASRGSEATRAGTGGRVVQRDGGLETGLRNGDDSHVVVHLDIVVNIAVAVHNHAGDAALDEAVGGGADEKNAAFVGNFGVVESLGRAVNRGDA